MKMWLDDIRIPPTSEWVWAKTYENAVSLIEKNGLPEHISFDHDLGDSEAKTGYDLAKWIVNADLDGKIDIPMTWTYALHTANPVGRENIRSLLDNYLSSK